ncbi:MAG: hypothetical protein ABI995_15970 [Acidobacteriota bacterium]
MSRDIKQYWQEVRAIEDRLPEFIWLVGTDADAAGFVTEAAACVAAKLLRSKSHRVATEEEVAAHHTSEQHAVRNAKHERMRLSGAAMVVVAANEEVATSGRVPRRRR